MSIQAYTVCRSALVLHERFPTFFKGSNIIPDVDGLFQFNHVFFFDQGIMLVYDITNQKSFENIRNWIRNIEEVCRTTQTNLSPQSIKKLRLFSVTKFKNPVKVENKSDTLASVHLDSAMTFYACVER